MTDVHEIPPMPMPTREQLRDGADSAAGHEIALLLFDHGINPWDLPAPKVGALEIVDATGYLRVVGIDYDKSEMRSVREPWPDTFPRDVVDRMVALLHGF